MKTIQLTILVVAMVLSGGAYAFGDADNSSKAQAGAIGVGIAGVAAGASASSRSSNSNRAYGGSAKQGQIQSQLQGQVGSTTEVTVEDNSTYDAARVEGIAPPVSAPSLVAGVSGAG